MGLHFRGVHSKNKALVSTSALFFVFVSARTQHHFAVKPQTSFDRSATPFRLRTQNDDTPCGVNEVAFGKQCCASHKRCYGKAVYHIAIAIYYFFCKACLDRLPII